ncbi:cation diffusion facilitator family transporter [Petroclostridium sp. X23]|uniref:cation diffusion facilitator family transporter n=1 Tax=Petroclostridium sp. X23 TaxID=3045146 RepID=UPI0024AD1FA2|nr:cation diffusion facilitator family transporter [Petroclostridium sp. X23]WHH57114.1 cation diffusion facilitator family transporter [Petroclostridium sp. X23]
MSNNSYKKVKQVLWIILFANLAVAGLKIIVGTMIKSTSMTADGFHSLTDGSSNIVGLIGLQFAAKPVDEDHPYGHRKFEMLAGLFIAGMLFVIGGKIIMDAVNRLMNPVLPDITLESLIALLTTLCVNILVCVFEYKKGKKLNSQILISDSMHTKSDIYVSIGVLATLVCIKLGLPAVVDPIASFIVVGFIFHAAYEIFKDNSGILVDRVAVDTEKIRNIALSFEQVKDTHNIRSRGSQNDLHIDMHIMTEPDLSVEKSHELIHNIEERIRKDINKNVQVIAHLEPFVK